MNVLQCNKFYFLRGGTEAYLFLLTRLLEERGHRVVPFAMQHPENVRSPFAPYFVSGVEPAETLAAARPGRMLALAARTLYSREARRRIAALLDHARPDVAHVHNIYHQLSPSILLELRRRGIRTVMTLHDYKLVCGNYQMLTRDGPCERCLGGWHYQATLQRCVKDSLAASLLASIEMYTHGALRFYTATVEEFICPSRFLLGRMKAGGIPADRLVHLPNFIDPTAYEPRRTWGEYVVYYGRLSAEKGTHVLLEAMRRLPRLQLVIAGSGPEEARLRHTAADLPNVRFAGFLERPALTALVREALCTVLPSLWYENCPLSVLEAFALARPVVASAIGGLPELVEDGITGRLVPPGDAMRLAEALAWMTDQHAAAKDMGQEGRRRAEGIYGPAAHYARIMELYQA